ncbi:hypothetical protein Y032_0146g2550 [Ancylostoma ceylanicum]|uniref:Uncharacterized protein n=1 Tax=Ancylostoma ceylanicum TaxID=53326 RepID=A0A016T2A8_9BILA|nr:hypothetical protein Y032_0146g2550 [Ancylostoma ceylanicum]
MSVGFRTSQGAIANFVFLHLLIHSAYVLAILIVDISLAGTLPGGDAVSGGMLTKNNGHCFDDCSLCEIVACTTLLDSLQGAVNPQFFNEAAKME